MKFIKHLIKKIILKYIISFKKVDGWLTDQEAIGLFILAFQTPRNAIIVEIGSWQGKSTYCLAKGLKSGKIFAIDPFNADGGFDELSSEVYAKKKGGDNLYDKFIKNMTMLGVLSKITVKSGYSYDFINEFDKIDLLFIDGDHSIEGCKKDFDLFSKKVVVGGYIAFHDYNTPNQLGPTYVIEKMVMNTPIYKFSRQYDSLWVAKKIAKN